MKIRPKAAFILLVLLIGCGKDILKPAPTAPSVTTGTASEVTTNAAKVGGEVTADGHTSVTVRGIVFSTLAAPTTNSSTVATGAGTGPFTAALINLLPGTTYHARAFATNSVGTSYGTEITFMTMTVVATLTTAVVTNITTNTATSGGEITNDGGAAVTSRGVCFGTAPNPTIANSITTNGSGTGAFISVMEGLVAATTYYVRAYAANSGGTSYGPEVTFMTLSIPTLTTSAIANISNTTASSGGDISSDNGHAVTARGVCWSTTLNPTTANSKTTNGGGTGPFTSSMTGLAASTLYHVRAYATNSSGTAYGDDVSFTTTCNAVLTGNVSYVTVVTAAIVSIAPCAPSVSGTTTLTMTAPGKYALGDASFGQYACAWNDAPAVGVNWEVNCSNQMVATGADQYGILWAYAITSNNGTTLVINWANDYGDAGTSTLTRTGGWPLNLAF